MRPPALHVVARNSLLFHFFKRGGVLLDDAYDTICADKELGHQQGDDLVKFFAAVVAIIKIAGQHAQVALGHPGGIAAGALAGGGFGVLCYQFFIQYFA